MSLNARQRIRAGHSLGGPRQPTPVNRRALMKAEKARVRAQAV